MLLAVALYSVVYSVIAANWVRHDTLLFICPAVGLLVGLVISKVSKVPQSVLHLLACLFGHTLAVLVTCMLAYHIPIQTLIETTRQAFIGGFQAMEAIERLFFFYLAFLAYFLGYFGSWLIYRARLPWLVALVYASIILVNLNYVKADYSYLVVILAGALALLIARVQLAAQIYNWRQDGLYTDRSWLRAMTLRRMQFASVITLLAVLGAWFLPIVAQPAQGREFWARLDAAWNNVVSGRITPENLGDIFNATPANFFSDRMTITGSVSLPTGEVLSYTTTANAPQYLQGFTYNVFDGRTWTIEPGMLSSAYFPAGATLPDDIVHDSSTSTIATNITMFNPPLGPKYYVFAPAQPHRFTIPTIVRSDVTMSAWEKEERLQKDERYTVESILPVSDSRLLSTVPLPSQNSSFWQQDRYYQALLTGYVQLPPNLSPAVERQMQAWTEGAHNAYDALKQIEKHLSDRNEFTYSIENTPIPSNTNVVDWLLQTRVGYCTYYASAMIVMARMLHIPTRMANGFSPGHYDSQRKAWVVNGSDAHSWVQAYFPQYGWVNFDPTPGFSGDGSQSLVISPPESTQPAVPTQIATATQVTQKEAPTKQPQVEKPNSSESQDERDNPAVSVLLTVLILLTLGISLVAGVVALCSLWWRRLYAGSSPIAGVYWRLCWLAGRVGFAPKPWQTPYEYSRALGQQVPQKAPYLWRLTELFVRERWGKGAARPEEAEQIHSALRDLHWQLFKRKWLRRTK
ncbi:hypothetical protein KTH_22750 [Thermosporothrix hazakensis]|nr:hypothetical protein KTH_22750 [Thermosporothrix hazakensis]